MVHILVEEEKATSIIINKVTSEIKVTGKRERRHGRRSDLRNATASNSISICVGK